MKKYSRIIMAAFLMLGIAACTPEEEQTKQPTLSDVEVTTLAVRDVTPTSALAAGEITKDGGIEITEVGICWGETENPDVKGSHSDASLNEKAFNCLIEQLEPGTTYHVRAYAMCGLGVVYGKDVTFTTLAATSGEVVVTTAAVSEITENSAVVGGEITNDGGNTITARGVCWGEEQNPDIEGEHLEIGAGTGTFSGTISGLKSGVTYYVRAYAESEAGITYGNEVNFTTTDPVITVADENFQAYLEYTWGDENGILYKSVAETITEMNIAEQGIASLEGIKQFTALEQLVASKNSIANVDVSGMTSLKHLDISWSNVALEGVNLDGCTALTTFIANDPKDGLSPKTFAPDTPALEVLNINIWRSIEQLDLSKCVNLKTLDCIQMFVVESLDLTHSNKLEHVWMADAFALKNFNVASEAMSYLGLANAKALTTLDVTGCPNLSKLEANDSYEVETFKMNCPNTLKNLNINCFRKITSLDLTEYVNLEFIDIIQLYNCTDLKLPKDLSNVKYIWLADALLVTQMDFVNVGPDARVKIWNCPALKTFNYSSDQEVIGWDYGDNPKEVTNMWTIPGNNIEVFNIDAPNVKKLYISNMHALKTLDLKKCPNVEYICMPEERVMTSVDFSNNSKLTDLLIWANHAITTLDLSECAMNMNELNIGTGNDACQSLTKVILKTGQTITNVIKEESVPFEYVD